MMGQFFLDTAFTKENQMRSLMTFVLVLSLTVLAGGVAAQDTEPAGDEPVAGMDSFDDDEIPMKKSGAPADGEEVAADGTAAPAEGPAAEGSETVMDAEVVEDKKEAESGRKVDFIGLKATDVWFDRNGLGAVLGIGGLTCARDYCNSTLDAQIFGSIAGTVGAYYRLNPNISFFGDATFAYVNTNFNQVATGDTGSSKEGAFEFQFLLGAGFHLPVTGWLDLYATAGLGPILLRAKAEAGGAEFTHHWGGIDIEMGLGADFYFWSVGFAKNLAIGPYMRLGFPIWPRVCAVAAGDGNEICARPSNQPDRVDYVWNKTPFIFHTGIEVRYDFGLEFGKTEPSEKDDEPAAEEDKPKKKREKKERKKREKKERNKDDDGGGGEISEEGDWDM